MNIVIVTLTGYFNYGNRLQNYALQQVLKEYSKSVLTLKNTKENQTTMINRSKLRFFTYSFSQLVNIVNNTMFNMLHKKSISIRTKSFLDFTKNYINELDDIVLNQNNLNELSDKTDFFISGSDQVWNPNYLYNNSINFLTFAPQSKRVTYAPSFGVSSINDEWKERYRKWISGIDHLSVREVQGKEIIHDLTDREAIVLIDPTMLLTQIEWRLVSKEASNKPKNKYLLTYFLGGIPKEYKRIIVKVRERYNLDVINLGDVRESATYETGPSEFIDYVDGCSLFFTDSFHGTVFSILFEKPFVVFDRQGEEMFSRIETLLNTFRLNERNSSEIDWNNDLFEIDYTPVREILSKEREKAHTYLHNALKKN